MLNLWRLQLLVQLANLKTMRAVAEALNVSPASVSVQLKELELALNSVLLEKQGRNVQLTAAGYQLVQQVQPILDQLEQVNNQFQTTSERVQGNVRIGGFDSCLRRIVIPVLTKIKQTHPKLHLSITESEPEQSLAALNAHQFDMVIIAKFASESLVDNGNNRWIALGSDQLKVLVSAQNPLAQRQQISVADLKQQQWILETPDAYISKYLARLCAEAEFQPRVFGTCQSYPLLQAGVANDLAVGVLPELAIMNQDAALKIVDFMPATSRHIYLVVRKPQVTLPAIQLVARVIQQQAARQL